MHTYILSHGMHHLIVCLLIRISELILNFCKVGISGAGHVGAHVDRQKTAGGFIFEFNRIVRCNCVNLLRGHASHLPNLAGELDRMNRCIPSKFRHREMRRDIFFNHYFWHRWWGAVSQQFLPQIGTPDDRHSFRMWFFGVVMPLFLYVSLYLCEKFLLFRHCICRCGFRYRNFWLFLGRWRSAYWGFPHRSLHLLLELSVFAPQSNELLFHAFRFIQFKLSVRWHGLWIERTSKPKTIKDAWVRNRARNGHAMCRRARVYPSGSRDLHDDPWSKGEANRVSHRPLSSVKRRAFSSSFHSSKPERVKAPQKAQCTM